MLSSRSSNIKVKHQTPSAEMRLARMTRRYRSANGAHERGVDYTGKQKAIKIPANRRAILFESLCFFFSPFLFFSSLFSFRARARARASCATHEKEKERGIGPTKMDPGAGYDRTRSQPGSGNDFGAAGGESETSSTHVSFLSRLLRAMSPPASRY